MREPRTSDPSSRRGATAATETGPGWRLLSSPAPSPSAGVERRRAPRTPAALEASTATIDAVGHGAGGACYQASDEDRVVNVSRRGLCVVCERPPHVGTRLWLQLRTPGAPEPVELVGRACWTQVRFEAGVQGARARCEVGVEILGGTPRALDDLDRMVGELERQSHRAIAAPDPLG